MPCELCGGREEISLCRMCARSEVARKTKFKDELIEELAEACKIAALALAYGCGSSGSTPTKVIAQLQTVRDKHKDLKNQGLL